MSAWPRPSGVKARVTWLFKFLCWCWRWYWCLGFVLWVCGVRFCWCWRWRLGLIEATTFHRSMACTHIHIIDIHMTVTSASIYLAAARRGEAEGGDAGVGDGGHLVWFGWVGGWRLWCELTSMHVCMYIDIYRVNRNRSYIHIQTPKTQHADLDGPLGGVEREVAVRHLDAQAQPLLWRWVCERRS